MKIHMKESLWYNGSSTMKRSTKAIISTAILALLLWFNTDFVKGQSNWWTNKEIRVKDDYGIKILPSWVYLKAHYNSELTLLEWIDKQSCKILYLGINYPIIEDKNGIYEARWTPNMNRPKEIDVKGVKGSPNYKIVWGKGYILISLSWVDKKSFQIVDEDFAFDDNKIYNMGVSREENEPWKIVEQDSDFSLPYDLKTLKVKRYGKKDILILTDKNGVYYQGRDEIKIEWADPETFAMIPWTKNESHFYDKNFIYFGSTRLCKNTWDKVQIIGDDIITDWISIFLRDKKIEWADLTTFEIDWNLFKDKSHVWTRDWAGYQWADPITFERVMKQEEFTGKKYELFSFFRDKNHVWIWAVQPIEWADPKTFKELDMGDPLYKYEDINAYYDQEWKKYPKK